MIGAGKQTTGPRESPMTEENEKKAEEPEEEAGTENSCESDNSSEGDDDINFLVDGEDESDEDPFGDDEDRPPLVLDSFGRTLLLTAATDGDDDDDVAQDDVATVPSLCHDACRSWGDLSALLMSPARRPANGKRARRDTVTTWAAVAADCAHTATSRASSGRGSYSSGDTFWVGSGDTPLCGLEAIAQSIFRLHTRSLRPLAAVGGDPGNRYDPAFSGAEWWTQDVSPGDEIGWHWDRDYTLEAAAGLKIYPHVATVTYASPVGYGTVVMDAPGGDGEGEDCVPELSEGKRAWVSLPAAGKHLAFDGRFLHGAPAETTERIAGSERGDDGDGEGDGEQKRTTLLVNLWINHRPFGVVPLPKDVLEKMTLSTADVYGVLCPSPPEKEGSGAVTGYAEVDLPAEAEVVKFEIPAARENAADVLTWKFATGGSDDEVEDDDEDDEEDDGGEGSSNRKHHIVKMVVPAEKIRESVARSHFGPEGLTIFLKHAVKGEKN
eukprot:CAMPEP_0194266744 /NCGR_PEP_ID=MMETSP0169-20130528/1550_1 /TAXON_ID=218684 /ORGANISM="Corethron pennatum, Strain L29A3" /LENGTH=494 /DNA_ID=CAMNT_0039007499 /DNA_START=62 /DNA_END=1546 /DNA_ORIENTATION=+